MKPATYVAALTLLSASAAVFALPQGRGGRPAPATDRGGTDRGEQAPEDDVSAVHFRTADWDGDGSIGFSEARGSLDLDREGFALYDADRDGLISPAEFAGRYRRIVERGGIFPAPRPKPDARLSARKDGPALLKAYDVDLDGRLGESEVAGALADARIDDPSAKVVLASLDVDRSGGLDGPELAAFATLLHPDERAEGARPRLTLEELFDRRLPRDTRAGSTIGPLRTAGPISVFRRLDHDRNGRIEVYDLEELQRPASGAVRPAAVVATMDLDGDGSISPAEFAAAMR